MKTEKALLLTFAALSAAALVPAFADAQDVMIAPAWSLLPAHVRTGAPLGMLSGRSVQDEQTILSFVGMDAKYAARKRQEYADAVRDYEMRERHGLVSRDEQAKHFEQMNGFARGMMGDVAGFALRDTSDKIQENAKNDATARAIAQPLAVAAGAYSILYRGDAMKFHLNDDLVLVTRSSLRDLRGLVQLSSSSTTGSLQVEGRSPTADPSKAEADPTRKAERIRTGVRHDLGFWDLSTGISYGVVTRTMTTSVSKQLTANLTGVIDNDRNIQSQSSEESVKLLFGVRF